MAQASETVTAPAKPKWGARLASFTTRLLLGIAGLALLLGFFMPWMTLGEAMTLSGMNLMLSSGVLVDSVVGESRGLLFLIPVCAVLLISTALFKPRLAAWAGLLTGGAIIFYGLFMLMRFFIGSTGPGLWITVVAAMLALAVSLIGFGRYTRSAR